MPKQRKSFGLEFFVLVIVGPPLSLGYLLLSGINPVLDNILRFPLLMFPWPNDPAVWKPLVLVSAAIWGFGATYLLILIIRGVRSILRYFIPATGRPIAW